MTTSALNGDQAKKTAVSAEKGASATTQYLHAERPSTVLPAHVFLAGTLQRYGIRKAIALAIDK